jgi:hypothetical protein
MSALRIMAAPDGVPPAGHTEVPMFRTVVRIRTGAEDRVKSR